MCDSCAPMPSTLRAPAFAPEATSGSEPNPAGLPTSYEHGGRLTAEGSTVDPIIVEIVGVPTQRDADGLALSSRNIYLSAEERRAARALPRALGEAAQAMREGLPVEEAVARARARLDAAGFAAIDYVALHDAESLDRLDALDRPARLLAAARIGTTRLIDNLPVDPA